MNASSVQSVGPGISRAIGLVEFELDDLNTLSDSQLRIYGELLGALACPLCAFITENVTFRRNLTFRKTG